METYGKIKTEQEVNDVVKEGIEAEKDESGPVRLIIKPGDMTKYYREKMNSIQKDLKYLNKLLLFTDSIPPLEHFGYNYFLLRDSVQFVDTVVMCSSVISSRTPHLISTTW